jgi:hypothetical protein
MGRGALKFRSERGARLFEGALDPHQDWQA